jgi:hypothetical protein
VRDRRITGVEVGRVQKRAREKENEESLQGAVESAFKVTVNSDAC